MKKITIYMLLFASLSFIFPAASPACTSYLVTRGASKDGSTLISYVADSHIRYGELYFLPGGKQEPGSFYQCYDRGSHKPLARIPNPALTYTVIGFMNEKQVAIGETTFGGRAELSDPDGMIDYGSLMFLAMQRSKTAREAIRVIAELTAEYGYTGGGESFSIGDAHEAWIMEIVGRGSRKELDRKLKKEINRDKGAIWVAMRIPDGCVSAHANQARITRIPMKNRRTSISSRELHRINDPAIEVVYSADVVSFARKKGYFKGKDEAFSFSEAYAPIDFGGARFCEARVWNLFRRVNADMSRFEAIALGQDLSQRLPLWISPDRKLGVEDLIAAKRDHLEGTPYDMALDPGAGPFALPYRWRPMTWKVDGKEYFHERTTATQQTAFSFIAQLRSQFPDPIGGISWFGVDDTNTTVYVPFYAGMTRVPEGYREGNGSILQFSENAAFWVFNQVAHLAYLRYNQVLPDIQKAQKKLEEEMRNASRATDKAALELYAKDPALARNVLTDFSVTMGERTLSTWKDLYRFLMVKHLDGNRKKEQDGVFLLNEYKRYPLVEHPEYPEWWRKLIIDGTGERFKTPEKH
jgi:dipeptidase